MTKIMLDIPKPLMKEITMIKIDKEVRTKQEVIITLLNKALVIPKHYPEDRRTEFTGDTISRYATQHKDSDITRNTMEEGDKYADIPTSTVIGCNPVISKEQASMVEECEKDILETGEVRIPEGTAVFSNLDTKEEIARFTEYLGDMHILHPLDEVEKRLGMDKMETGEMSKSEYVPVFDRMVKRENDDILKIASRADDELFQMPETYLKGTYENGVEKNYLNMTEEEKKAFDKRMNTPEGEKIRSKTNAIGNVDSWLECKHVKIYDMLFTNPPQKSNKWRCRLCGKTGEDEK